MTMKYELHITSECKQNLKRCKRRGLPMHELWAVVGKLLNGETLNEKYHAHQLHGDRQGQWECHILSRQIYDSFGLRSKGSKGASTSPPLKRSKSEIYERSWMSLYFSYSPYALARASSCDTVPAEVFAS